MSAILTTFLLSTLTLYTKKAVGSFFEKDSIIGAAATETSAGMVKSAFEHFKNKFELNIYQTPDNEELLRAVRMAYLNSALCVCFARLKSLDMGKWNTLISQYLPQNEDASFLTKKLREQFLPADALERKEAEWIFSASQKLEESRSTINGWKPNDDFQIAVRQIELFLMTKDESVAPLILSLKSYLSSKLITEFAELASFQTWNETLPPSPPNSPSSPENTDISERQITNVQGVFTTNAAQGSLDLTTTQRLSNYHKSCLPPKLLSWIENGWEEIEQSQSAANPLGLGGKSKSFEWFDIMCAFFAQELKQNQKVADIFQNKLLLDLKYRDANDQVRDLSVDIFRDELAKQNEMITARLKIIEDEIGNLNAGQTDIKAKVENLLPMILTVNDISQTVKSIAQDVKAVLGTVTETSKDVKQLNQKMDGLPDQMTEELRRRFEEFARNFSAPSGKREEVIDIQKLKIDLERIDMQVNSKFSDIVIQLLEGLDFAKKLPLDDSSAKTEREKYLHFLGLVYLLIGRIDDAIIYHQDAANWAESNLPAQKKIVNLCNLGNVYVERGELGKAVACYDKAMQILRQNPAPGN